MCEGSKLAITIGRWRRHCSPFEEKRPPNPICRAVAFSFELRWKPSGRSRRTAAMASGLAMARNSRLPMRKRKNSP